LHPSQYTSWFASEHTIPVWHTAHTTSSPNSIVDGATAIGAAATAADDNDAAASAKAAISADSEAAAAAAAAVDKYWVCARVARSGTLTRQLAGMSSSSRQRLKSGRWSCSPRTSASLTLRLNAASLHALTVAAAATCHACSRDCAVRTAAKPASSEAVVL
jgi:hypothetical protein